MPFLQQLSKQNLCKIIIGNNWDFPPLGIILEEMQPEKAEVWILTTQCLDETGLDILGHTLGSPVTWKNPVTTKGVTGQEHTRQSDTQ